MSDSILSQPVTPPHNKSTVVLTPTMTVPTAVQRIIQQQTLVFERMLPIALHGDDIEGVHKVRVSLRRMRTVLKVTRPYFQKKTLVATRIDLKFVRQVFGRVRDMDVFKESFSHFFSEFAPGLELDSTIWDPVFDFTYQDYSAQIHAPVTLEIIDQLKETLSEYQSANSVLKNPGKLAMLPGDLSAFLPIILQSQLEGILSFELGEIEDRNYPRHHQLRLLIKAHRYTYEFFQSVLGSDASSQAIGLLIHVQDYLGELNDSVQAIRLLSTHQSPRHPQAVSDSLTAYIEFERERQTSLVSSFPQIWDNFLEADLQGLLTQAVSPLQ